MRGEEEKFEFQLVEEGCYLAVIVFFVKERVEGEVCLLGCVQGYLGEEGLGLVNQVE